MSDMAETNPTAPLYDSPSCIPRIIKSHVEELFKKDAPFRRGEWRRNPVYDTCFVQGEDPIAPQKRLARRALLAREWFYEFGPHDAPPLPVSVYEIEDSDGRTRFTMLSRTSRVPCDPAIGTLISTPPSRTLRLACSPPILRRASSRTTKNCANDIRPAISAR
jgi:hypothetical protein